VPLVEQELLTFAGHLSSLPVFSGVRVTRSLVLCICFVDRCLSFCTFSFCHCVVCSSSTYGFWLPLWYLQTLLPSDEHYFSFIMTRTFQCDDDVRFVLYKIETRIIGSSRIHYHDLESTSFCSCSLLLLV
jgi:hypothetical protein